MPQILRRELKRNASWVAEEEERLRASDESYRYFMGVRDDPAHRAIIHPVEQKRVEILERIHMRGSVEVDLLDATGRPVARVQHCASVGADSGIHESARVNRKYFLKGVNDEAVTVCDAALAALSNLVGRAEQKFHI